MKSKLSDLFQILYLSSFFMAGAYVWLGVTQWFLDNGKVEPASWLFFSVPAGVVFFMIYNFLLRFNK